jgi:putative phosphoribosyl transferase
MNLLGDNVDRDELLADRTEAGRLLAAALQQYAGRDDVIVLGLPRGGVVVAAEVARRLHAPLDVFLVRKLGVPGHEELAMGAIALGGARVMNMDVVSGLGITQKEIDAVIARENAVLERRRQQYRGDAAPPSLENKIVIVVDDGLATGATMRAAVQAIKSHMPAKVIVGVPTAPRETCEMLRREAEEVVCLMTPEPFYALSLSYSDFAQVSDDEVRKLLEEEQ